MPWYDCRRIASSAWGVVWGWDLPGAVGGLGLAGLVSLCAGVCWASVSRVGSGWLVGRPGGPLVGGGRVLLVYVRALLKVFAVDPGPELHGDVAIWGLTAIHM